MKFCIMHFESSFLRIFVSKKLLQEFLYGVLLVLSRCCFHHLVKNSILYKKDIQHFCIGPILFSENKIIRSMVGGKVDSQIYLAPGVRNRKFYLTPGMRNGKIYLAPSDSFEKFYLAVNGLRNYTGSQFSHELYKVTLFTFQTLQTGQPQLHCIYYSGVNPPAS